MDNHGVFISHSHRDWAIAGRIFDYLSVRGFYPFLDVSSMKQGNFHKTLELQIKQTPYFLCILTAHTFQKMDADSWICTEIRTALKSERKILLLAEKGFTFPANIPSDIEIINHYHCYEYDRENFLDVMERMCTTDIQRVSLVNAFDWRQRLHSQSNLYLSSREDIENNYATLEHRFGAELVRCVRNGEPFTGKSQVRFVHMSCYAANVIFSPGIEMVDEQAFDRGLLFNILAELLKDEEFSLEIIITAPGCYTAQDAIDYEKLGNRALEAYPEACFLSSYCNIDRLIHEDPIFQNAYKNKRFRFLVTDSGLSYALFHIAYKPNYESYDHIKIDLYSEGLQSSVERRSMLLFKEDNWENYQYFVDRYTYIRNVRKSKKLISENHKQWMTDWHNLLDEMA